MRAMSTIYDYMRSFSNELSERILSVYEPLHGPADPEFPVLSRLKRALLPAQKLVVMAVAKRLQQADSAKIVGECGTGKSLMGVASCYAHAQGKSHTGAILSPPHLVEKWAREIFISIPDARVFMIHDMRNGSNPKQPHGVFEVRLEGKRLSREGWSGSLADLRLMGREGWKKLCPEPAWFIIGRERGKLTYCWDHAYQVAKSGKNAGSVVNPDTGIPVEIKPKKFLTTQDFGDHKHDFKVERGNDTWPGHTVFSPLWQADRNRIQRMAPLEYIGRYMPDWFDYGLADEIQEYNEDTIQGGGLEVMSRACRKIIGMTGTLLGGKARDVYGILCKMDAPRMARDGYIWGGRGERMFQEAYGTVEEVQRVDYSLVAQGGKEKRTKSYRWRPGASPLLFGKYLMHDSAFVFLEDISRTLPSYEEEVVGLDMSPEQQEAYEHLEESIRAAIKAYPRSGSRITSMMLHALMCYPDHPFDFAKMQTTVKDKQNGLVTVDVATPVALDKDVLYPKEEWLIEYIRRERREGRRVMVYATYTTKHDVTARLNQVLTDAGFKVAVLKAAVPTDRREAWIEKQVEEGVDVVLCHPRLVQTGLDLLDFPSIVFYESGHSLFTLRQASRRSWRIPQKRPVRVKFLSYNDTVQERCLSLMGKKLTVALGVEGKFANEGLQAASEDDAGDILTAIARELVSEAHIGESANAVWSALSAQQKLIAQTGPETAVELPDEACGNTIAELPEVPDSMTLAPVLSDLSEAVGEVPSVETVAFDVNPALPSAADIEAALSATPPAAIAFPDWDQVPRPPARKRRRFVSELQMSLFEPLEAA